MKRQNQSNALLVELLIVILFFMLGAVILIQVFDSAHQMTERSRILSQAMVDAQNVADTLYVSEDPLPVLEQLAFSREDGTDSWIRQEEGYTLTVTASREPAGEGSLNRLQVQAASSEEILLTLPCSRYLPEAEDAA